MLTPLPDILIGVVQWKNRAWQLNENATEEQRKAFAEFIKEDTGDTIIIK